ncbi:MAG: hypothetical protein WCO44_17115 [Bacteroidota bacterium]
MNTREIEVLLAKFYEGETSLQEEKMLREYFRGGAVAPNLKSHQPMFAFFEDERKQAIGDAGFEKKISEQLTDATATALPVFVPLNRRVVYYYTAIAATFLLLIGVSLQYQFEFFKMNKPRHNSLEQELAYHNASEALLILSSNFNTGLKQVSRLSMVDKAMKNVQIFNKFYQYQPININPDDDQYKSDKTK